MERLVQKLTINGEWRIITLLAGVPMVVTVVSVCKITVELLLQLGRFIKVKAPHRKVTVIEVNTYHWNNTTIE
jgi:hypothetical protein